MSTSVASVSNPLDEMVTKPVQPRASSSSFFGQVVTLDGSAWKLVKGQGRVPFDETYDDPADKVRAITLQIECEKQDGSKYIIDTGRNALLEIDKAWHKHLLPSIQKLNVPFSQLKDAFVQVKRVETGEKYTDSKGEEKSRTALEFVAIYPDYQAMQAAREALYGRERTAQPAQPASAAAAAPTVDKEALIKVLPALWRASGQNKEMFATMFQASKELRESFTVEEALEAAILPF